MDLRAACQVILIERAQSNREREIRPPLVDRPLAIGPTNRLLDSGVVCPRCPANSGFAVLQELL